MGGFFLNLVFKHTHTHTHIYIYIYIYREREREKKERSEGGSESKVFVKSSSSYCRAISTDIPDTLSTPILIVHRFR